MPNLNNFLCVRGLKSLYSCGILHGGGLKAFKTTRKTSFLTTNQNNKFLVQNAQSLQQNNKVFLSKFAFGCVKSFRNKIAFTYNNLIKKLQGVFRNADFSFYLRL